MWCLSTALSPILSSGLSACCPNITHLLFLFFFFWEGFTEFSKLRALSDTVSCFSSLCFCLAHSLDSILKPAGCVAGLSGMARHMWFSIISRFSLFCLSVYPSNVPSCFPQLYMLSSRMWKATDTQLSDIYCGMCCVGWYYRYDLCISDIYICETLVPSFKNAYLKLLPPFWNLCTVLCDTFLSVNIAFMFK